MKLGRIEFGKERVNVHLIHYTAFDNNEKYREIDAIPLEDLTEMFGLNTDVSDLPPMSNIDTLHRRNATAIKRRLQLCN